jgi:hypothetical protein
MGEYNLMGEYKLEEQGLHVLERNAESVDLTRKPKGLTDWGMCGIMGRNQRRK